jgi:hypothetical protein
MAEPPKPHLTGEAKLAGTPRIIRSPSIRKQRKKASAYLTFAGLCIALIILTRFFRLPRILGGASIPPDVNYYLTILLLGGMWCSYCVGVRLLLLTKQANYWGWGIGFFLATGLCVFVSLLTAYIGLISLVVVMIILPKLIEFLPDKSEANARSAISYRQTR